jgi:hypothetical protein
MSPADALLLRRWLALIDRLRDRGALNAAEADALRAEAVEAATS